MDAINLATGEYIGTYQKDSNKAIESKLQLAVDAFTE